jgi:3-oxoacyl-[acyl-carrier-protein] synthase II
MFAKTARICFQKSKNVAKIINYKQHDKLFSTSASLRSELPPPKQLPQRRVVVTGLGMVTPLGADVATTWTRLTNGECAVDRITTFDTSQLPCKVSAMVKRGTQPGEFNVEQWVPKTERGKISSFIEFAIAAATQALKDANWTPSTEEEFNRTGVAIGCSMGAAQEIADTYQLYKEKGYRRVSPYFLPRVLSNLAAGQVSIFNKLRGPNHCASTACTTGAHSIGDAFKFIQRGDADVMVAGATDAAVDLICVAGFCRAMALSTSFNDTPQLASRPFDKDRDGFVMGEGAGAMILEDLEHAVKRGAKIYAEIRGYGLSGDANHVTSPAENGIGAQLCMRAAIEQSGLRADQIGYINAHATSTPLGDRIENYAMKSVFGPNASQLSVSSTKGAVGHLLGAAGAVEAIFTVLALHTGILPPTINLHNLDPEFTLDYIPNKAINKSNLIAAMSNSFGFGGTNASLLFSVPPKL